MATPPPDTPRHRPVLVLGLLPAGLALARSLGRAGIPVYGGVFRPNEFGLRSRYLRGRCVATAATENERDRRLLDYLRALSRSGRPILVPERDEHVEFVLRNWDEVVELADVPLPPDPDVVHRLRRKDLLPLAAAEAGVAAPATFPLTSEAALRSASLEPPFLLKPAEGQEYALRFGDKAVVAGSVDEAVAAWRRAQDAGFEMILQELIPDSHEQVFSLFAYVGRDGRAPRERRRTQGAAGTTALRDERGLRDPLRRRGARARSQAPRLGGLSRVRACRVRARSTRRRVQGARGEHASPRSGRESP